VGAVKAPRGEKHQTVIDGIEQRLARPGGGFKLSELEQPCPGVSRDLVRHVLREQRAPGLVSCSGRGVGALWSKLAERKAG
jgi:hypothetical protein